jgi:hypothetical protein
MKTAEFVGLITVLLLCGCQCGRHAGPAAVAPTLNTHSDVPAPVMVKGNVLNSMVPWTEDLTVAKAILTAEYLGVRDPVSISIRRDGELFFVNQTWLLLGAVDPWLEPGDILELHTAVLLNPPLALRPSYRSVVLHRDEKR